MKSYKIKYTRNGKSRTVTVHAENTSDAIDQLPDDCEDIDVVSVTDDSEGTDTDGDGEPRGEGKDRDGDESGADDSGESDDDSIEIISVEEIEDDGADGKESVDENGGDSDSQEKDDDEVEPQDEHWWFKGRGRKVK